MTLVTTKMHTSQKISNERNENPFHINNTLQEYFEVKIVSPNQRQEQETTALNVNQETVEGTNKANLQIINELRVPEVPDSIYNYKKSFLSLSFSQTEDQNSLQYKQKELAKKLMTDVTFSLNKIFEFSFIDKIKNNIINNLERYGDGDNSDVGEGGEMKFDKIDNDFILNNCNGESYHLDGLINNSKHEKMQRRMTYLGTQGSTEDIEIAKKSFTPDHCCHVVFNYNEDEELNRELYKFFVDYINEHQDRPLASKVKLVLSYLDEINPQTGKPIYKNKDKNKILSFWKEEYDKAVRFYQEKKEREEEEKRELEKLREKREIIKNKKYSATGRNSMLSMHTNSTGNKM